MVRVCFTGGSIQVTTATVVAMPFLLPCGNREALPFPVLCRLVPRKPEGFRLPG